MHADGAIRRPEQMPCPFSAFAEDCLEEAAGIRVVLDELIEKLGPRRIGHLEDYHIVCSPSWIETFLCNTEEEEKTVIPY